MLGMERVRRCRSWGWEEESSCRRAVDVVGEEACAAGWGGEIGVGVGGWRSGVAMWRQRQKMGINGDGLDQR